MTSQKYLNGVLTVIAFCLVILTLSVVGAFPKANAAANQVTFAKVDVVRINGNEVAKAPSGALPVFEVKK